MSPSTPGKGRKCIWARPKNSKGRRPTGGAFPHRLIGPEYRRLVVQFSTDQGSLNLTFELGELQFSGDEGRQKWPVGGFLYFVFTGKTSSIKSLELICNSTALRLR